MPLTGEAKREYHREYMRKRLASDPEFKAKHLARVRRNTIAAGISAREVVAEFHKGGCIRCGERDLACLDAHHVDGSEKDHNIGWMVQQKRGLSNIRAELKKCVSLCANCHRKFHAGRFEL